MNTEVLCSVYEDSAWTFLGSVNLPDGEKPRRDGASKCYGNAKCWPVAVWYTVLRPEGPPYYELKFSAWDGQGWTPQEIIPTYQPPELGEDTYPDVAVGPDGRVWVAWLKADEGPDYDKDIYVTYSDDALPVVVHDESVGLVEDGVELKWKASGYGDLGFFDVYRMEAASDSCEGRDIPEGAIRVNEASLPGAEVMSYVDIDVEDEAGYCYWLEHIGANGTQRSYEVGHVVVPLRELGDVIRRVYPNPSVGGMWVEYEMSEGGEVSFEVFDVGGRVIRSVNVGLKPRGVYTGERGFRWDGLDGSGREVPSGVYLVRMVVGGRPSSEAKAVLVRR